MKRIIVIGRPGSGKSTLSRKLYKMTGIPLFHLDMPWVEAEGEEDADEFLEQHFKTEI